MDRYFFPLNDDITHRKKNSKRDWIVHDKLKYNTFWERSQTRDIQRVKKKFLHDCKKKKLIMKMKIQL